MIYFLNTAYRLQKLRAVDGVAIFDVYGGVPRYNPPGWNLVLAGGVVVAPRVDLFAFDTATGAPAWTYVDPELDETGYSSITSDSHTVYAASRLGRLHAVNAYTGQARWIADLREGSSSVGALSPRYRNSLVFVCTRSVAAPIRGSLWALNAADGTVRWRHAFEPELPGQGSACYGRTAFWNDLAIQPQEDGRVYAFDIETGAVRWISPRVHDVNTSLGDIRFPAVGDDHLIVTSSANRGMIVAHDPSTGAETWRYSDNGGSLYQAHIADGVVWVDHAYRYASYDLITGRLLWQTPEGIRDPATTYVGRPVVGSDRIFVAGRDGSYALRR